LLAHLAFNAPLASRDERAKAFLNRHQDVLGRFKGKAREVLELQRQFLKKVGLLPAWPTYHSE
jgi:type II secretory pathway component PulM